MIQALTLVKGHIIFCVNLTENSLEHCLIMCENIRLFEPVELKLQPKMV